MLDAKPCLMRPAAKSRQGRQSRGGWLGGFTGGGGPEKSNFERHRFSGPPFIVHQNKMWPTLET